MEKKSNNPPRQQHPKKRQLKQFCITTQQDQQTITTTKLHSTADIVDERRDKKSSDWLITESGCDTQKQIDLRKAECRLIDSLGLPSVLKNRINDKLRDALANGDIHVNIRAFTIIKDRYSEYDKVKIGCEYYEKLTNDFVPQIRTKDELSSDLINFERRYCELLQICNYFEQMRRPLHYMIYKRVIEMVDTTPIHDDSDFLDKYFMPKRTGFYYAIIVNFGLSYSNARTNSPPIKIEETSDKSSISSSSSSS